MVIQQLPTLLLGGDFQIEVIVGSAGKVREELVDSVKNSLNGVVGIDTEDKIPIVFG